MTVVSSSAKPQHKTNFATDKTRIEHGSENDLPPSNPCFICVSSVAKKAVPSANNATLSCEGSSVADQWSDRIRMVLVPVPPAATEFEEVMS